MMMNPNILNKNPLMFFDRAVNAQRSQLLTVMADAVSECRTAADQAAELNETGQVGLLRLAEVWSAIRAKEGMGGLVLEGTEAKILSDWWHSFTPTCPVVCSTILWEWPFMQSCTT